MGLAQYQLCLTPSPLTLGKCPLFKPVLCLCSIELRFASAMTISPMVLPPYIPFL
jgi:hypothetical protein